MKRQEVSRQRSHRLVSCLFFGGMLLAVPQLMADKPTMSQSNAGSSSASSAQSNSGSSGASASSRSSGSSRSSASGSSRSSQPRASAPSRTNHSNTPANRGNARRHRSSNDEPKARPNTSSSGQASQGNHSGRHGSRHGRRYGHGYGGGHRYHSHYSGCGHYGYGGYGYGYYGYGYPYRYYGPFGYIYYRQPHAGGYSGYSGEDMGALDLDVRPEKAQVFVDGTLVGVADQYDGFPAYLWLEKGTYDVVVYKEGYETISRQYTVYPGVVLDVSDHMVSGVAVKPEDLYAKSTVRRDERQRRNEERRAAARQRDGGQVELHQQSGSAEPDVARLLLNVTPSDAAAYLDGHFLGTAGELSQLSAGLIVEPGDHMLEVVRPGFETQRVPVQIPAGDKITIDLELAPR